MQNPAVANTYLNVSFKDKDAAKALGARWDGLQKQWFVPPGRELAPFAQWQGCKSFCVNGQLAGNCRIARSDDDRSEERCTQGVAGQPIG